METAEAVAAALGLTVEADPDLREIDFGRWEGRTFEEIQQSDPQAVSDWATRPAEFAFPGGEAVRDFVARVGRAADRLAADPAEAVLAVTHGGVVRVAICHLLGLAVENYLLFDVRPACLAAVELFDGKGVLIGLDNSCSGDSDRPRPTTRREEGPHTETPSRPSAATKVDSRQ